MEALQQVLGKQQPPAISPPVTGEEMHSGE